MTTESFTGTIIFSHLRAYPDPTTSGAIDVSECFDNSGSRNTSLATGKIITDRIPAGQYTTIGIGMPWPGKMASGMWYLCTPSSTIRRRRSASHVRRRALAFLSLAGLTVWLAGPVSAGAFVGCTGNTCSVSLSTLITLKGDVGNGAAHVQLPVAPPPCLWQPIGNTTVGSTTIVRQLGSAARGKPFGVYQSVRQARMLLRDKPVPPGTWWQLPVNPAASKAAQKLCFTLPLFDFTTPGQAPPAPPVPLQTLADYAYNHMAIPAPTLTVNPAGRVTSTWPPTCGAGPCR